jgi:hypothetical protein
MKHVSNVTIKFSDGSEVLRKFTASDYESLDIETSSFSHLINNIFKGSSPEIIETTTVYE